MKINSIKNKYFQNISLLKCLPLVAIFSVIFLFFYFELYQYLTLDALKQHHQALISWVEHHYLTAVLLYISMNILVAAAAIPCGIFFTISSGMIFGTFLGAIYTMIGVSIGGVIIFLAVKLAFAEWFKVKAAKWLDKIEYRLEENAFKYVLYLRLIPVLPFSIVNIIAALLNISLPIYFSATILGIIPVTLIYTSLGHNLEELFYLHNHEYLTYAAKPAVVLPMVLLFILSMVPTILKKYKARNKTAPSKI